MPSVRELHDRAMQLAVDAQRARSIGDFTAEAEFARQASAMEAQAASQLNPIAADEPTRAILLFSAASLAWQAGEVESCRRLCCDGLRGFPPPEYERDFNDLFEKANAARHLDLRSIELNPWEFQVSLQGGITPPGFAPITEITNRLTSLSTMLIQSVRRACNKPYQDLRKKAGFDPGLVPYASAFREGSFSVTVGLVKRLGEQPPLPSIGLTVDPSVVIDDFLENMDFLSHGNLDELQNRIGDDSYLVNFMAHAKEIAPDGKRIRMVGFSRGTRKVDFSISRKNVNKLRSSSDDSESKVTTLRGTLVQADMDRASIGLKIESEKQARRLKVDKGLEDIVRSYFGKEIEATGVQKKTFFELQDIDPVTDEEGTETI